MTASMPQTTIVNIRPIQYRDLEQITHSATEAGCGEGNTVDLGQQLQQIRRWYGVLKCFSWFPNPLRDVFCAYVAEYNNQLQGMIRVSPFNRTRSTWRVDQVWVERSKPGNSVSLGDLGSQLLRHCFQSIWEARTWLVEVNVNDTTTLALYRQNGFQTLAHLTYWTIALETLETLAQREADLPNLLPVSNADASLLYQLDTQSMPSFVRQVYDRHLADFKTGLLEAVSVGVNRWVRHRNVVSGYVFEPQRKAAIGYFQLQLCRDGSQPHVAELTVHPAYTWLYPELLTQMAQVTKEFPAQALRLVSADYQPEREEFLEQLGATRTEHTLMMSRSVWHKIRESKFSLEALQLTEMLQGLQPARKPVPGRFSFAENLPPDLEEAESGSPRPDTTEDPGS